MARVLALGDLHIQPDNLADINVYLSQLRKYLASTRVDMIVILGDTLHTHEIVYSQCMNKMLDYIHLCQEFAPTYILVGNHEYISNQMYLNDNHPFVGWKGKYNIVDRVKHVEVKGKNLVLCPYVPDGRFVEALNTGTFDWTIADCIFGHQLLNKAKMGAITAKDVEDWKPEYPMLISGHIHDKQNIGENLHYTGSSIQVAFGEREDHTISMVTVDGKVTIANIEEVNIYPPTKKTVYTDISRLKELKLPQEENTKIKLSISGDAEEFKTFKKTTEYKDMIKKGVKVVFKQKRSVQANLPSSNHRTFPEILYELVEKDPDMMAIYHTVLGSKEGNVEIVFD